MYVRILQNRIRIRYVSSRLAGQTIAGDGNEVGSSDASDWWRRAANDNKFDGGTYLVDGECVTLEVLRLVAVDDVIGPGHVTLRVDLAPAQGRPEVVGRACAEQLAAMSALGDGENVVVRRYHVTVKTTAC